MRLWGKEHAACEHVGAKGFPMKKCDAWFLKQLQTRKEDEPRTVHHPVRDPDTEGCEAIQSAWALLGLVNDWVRHAEAKLGVVLAFLGALSAGLVALVIEIGHPSLTMALIEVTAAVLLMLSVGSAGSALLPQHAPQDQRTRANPLYYGDIRAHYSSDEAAYLAELKSTLTNRSALVELIGRQVLANSAVAHRKFARANSAILLGLTASIAITVVGVGASLDW